MKRVLLIQPPLEDFYTTPIRLYPLGLLYVSRVFQKLGFQVEILDCLNPPKKRVRPLPEKFSYLRPYLGRPLFFKNFQHFGLTVEEAVLKAGESRPDFIGINSSFAAYFSTASELARWLKEKYHIPLIIGGNQATAAAAEIKDRAPWVDLVVGGQAERVLPEFLRKAGYLPAGQESEAFDWKELQPAHELLLPAVYRIGKKNYLSLQASRGCPHSCSFCNVHLVFGRVPDYRSVSSVLEEMRWNYERRQVRIFNFEDDNLSTNRDWFREFLEAVASDEVLAGSELTFMNGLGPENLDSELLALMKRAGVRKLDLSWVSGNQSLRQKHHRPQKKDEPQFFELLKEARRLGFFVTVYLILGLPGQTKEEIIETTEKLLALDVLVGPSVFYLTPGSELHRTLPLPPEIAGDWDMYRATALAVETEELKRRDLIELFLDIRRRNLERRDKTFRFSAF
ncbi:MAG: radical SAM protein [Candidatus Saccharicenans sp.]|nr:radical SAM protein [Candidatus Saccharicenans sp.]